MTQHKREDIKKLGWDEYINDELEVLLKKVQNYIEEKNIKIDAVVPLLRGGNIPATYLAYKLSILRITPVQYKYFFKEGKADLVRIQKVNEDLFEGNSEPTFLLVEGNHCFGTAATYAAKGLKEQFPNCRIIYAASNMDYNYKNVVDEFVSASFYGGLQNACEELSREECLKLGIDPDKVTIFPWENEDEEWTTFGEMKQHPFSDIIETEERGRVVETFDLSTIFKTEK